MGFSTLTCLRRPRLRFFCALLLFISVVGFLSWRTARHLHQLGNEDDAARWGMIDFRDVIYFPTRAVIDGVNPYDSEPTADTGSYLARYPVGNVFPIYSPLLLLLDAPFQLLPYRFGMLCYGGLNVTLLLGTAWLVLRLNQMPASASVVLLLASGMLISRPGQSNFYYGQLALPMVLCTILATHATMVGPFVATVAVIATTIKPTFGAPLLGLLLCQRRWKIALPGGAAGLLVAIIGWTAIFTWCSSYGAFAEVLSQNVSQTEADPGFDPRLTGVRLDAIAVVQKLLPPAWDSVTAPVLFVGILAISGAVLWLLSSRTHPEVDQPLSASLTAVTMLICIFHAVYDGLLLVLPIVALISALSKPHENLRKKWTTWLLLSLLLFPAVNVFSSRQFWYALESRLGVGLSFNLPAFWSIVTALNGVCLLAAWGLLVARGIITWTKRREPLI